MDETYIQHGNQPEVSPDALRDFISTAEYNTGKKLEYIPKKAVKIAVTTALISINS
jgi:hypothetical protein